VSQLALSAPVLGASSDTLVGKDARPRILRVRSDNIPTRPMLTALTAVLSTPHHTVIGGDGWSHEVQHFREHAGLF